MGPEFLLFYIYIFSGFLIALFCVLMAIFLFFSRRKDPKIKLVVTSLIVLAFFAATANYAFFHFNDPDYISRKQQERRLEANLSAAKNIDFPTYKSGEPGVQQTAEVVYRHPPTYVLLSTEKTTFKLTVYQYKNGTRPYTLTQLPNGSCDNQPACKVLGESSFGTVYVVHRQSPLEFMYFASNGRTNLFLDYNTKPMDSEVLDFVSKLIEVKPTELPFRNSP